MEGLTSSPVALWWEWVGLLAQLDIVGPWRLRGRREQRVGLLRAAPHAVGHPLVVHIDLFFADRPAEGPREVGQVVPDRIVVLAVERADPLPAGARRVVRYAERGASVQPKVKMFVPSVAMCANRSVRTPRLTDRQSVTLNVPPGRRSARESRSPDVPAAVWTSRS